MKRLWSLLAALCTVALLAACAGRAPAPGTGHPALHELHIDRTVHARSQDSRVDTIVIHYTATSTPLSLKILSEKNVSSHYLITDDPTPHVYQLVDESRAAWHAGESSWYGRTSLNARSIGIELVNRGLQQDGTWDPWHQEQIDTLVILLRNIIARHQIKDRNIVGHSDVAPQRKIDPGPLFPWKALAEHGIGRWYDASRAAEAQAQYARRGVPDVAWIQEKLERAGYEVPRHGRLDTATRKVIRAFQMHYRPRLHKGEPDAETAAILSVLP